MFQHSSSRSESTASRMWMSKIHMSNVTRVSQKNRIRPPKFLYRACWMNWDVTYFVSVDGESVRHAH